MVQIWSMLATADTRLAAHTLERLPRAPSSAAWITYVRCHDDIGWAITDEDTSGVGLSGYHHRRFLSDWYSGLFPGSTAHGLVFQENPATGDRRISGTTAALTGLGGAGCRAPRRSTARSAGFFLTHAIVYAWGGIPVVWSGDELGMANDPGWAAEQGHETDNRWAHRPRLDWRRGRAAARPADGRRPGVQRPGPPRPRPGVAARTCTPACRSEVLPVEDGGVLAIVRRAPIGAMVCLYNITPETRPYPAWRLRELGLPEPWDAISERVVEPDGEDNYWLTPYAAWWLVERPDAG